MSDSIVIEDVVSDVKRMQDFDTSTLVRREQLGDLNFDDAIVPAQHIISVYQKLPIDAIREFPFAQLQTIQQQAKADFAQLDQILKFSLTATDPQATRLQYIESLKGSYQTTFNALYPLISYSVARTVDFSSLERNGRAAIQAINDDKEKVLKAIQETADQAARILQDVRDAAAEQGVTQTAKYFGDEAASHEAAAGRWLIASIVAAVVVAIYSASTLVWSGWFVAGNAFESAQMITSKLLVFGVLVYGLFQCVRSYSAHRHNQVTNKHRQNALMTYKTLAEAGNSPELRDAVLQHAAAAIYAPNDTGYLKSEERGYGAQSLLALLPRNPGSTSGTGTP
jgi:hypothetical protein